MSSKLKKHPRYNLVYIAPVGFIDEPVTVEAETLSPVYKKVLVADASETQAPLVPVAVPEQDPVETQQSQTEDIINSGEPTQAASLAKRALRKRKVL